MKQAEPKPCDVVLEAVKPPKRSMLWLAGVGALVLHLGGAAVAMALASTAQPPKPHKVKAMVVIDHVVDLNPPPAPKVEQPPPPPPPELPPPPAVKQPKIKAPQEAKVEAPAPAQAPPAPENAPEPEKAPSEPPPAAQAAQVVAAEGAGGSFQVATGSGSSYAGGTTTSAGIGTKANHTGQVGKGDGNGYSKARPAQLASRSAPCGWPPEAEEFDVDIVHVALKVVVKANGEVGDVTIVKDPGGYGFAKRAVWCVRSKMRFEAALDANGAPLAGELPMSVKFERRDDL